MKTRIFSKSRTNKRAETYDISLIITIVLLALIGTIMVFSAGGAYAYARYGDYAYFIKRQTVWITIGFISMYIFAKINISFVKKSTVYIYAITLLLLVLVLVIGLVGNGAKRWISIGPFTLQPSEIAKISIILMLALYFSEYREKAFNRNSKKTIFIYGTLFPILIMLIPIILVMLQKHLSCIIILGLIGLSMIVISGIDTRYIRIFCGGGALGVCAIAFLTDYTKERITVWQDPEKYKLTGGWQTLQGLMAIGSGGLFGVGLGKSVMKHCYVSEPANDMIFAILCEETGLVGATLTLLIFAILIYRGYTISLTSCDMYSRLVAFGISTKMAIQVLLNVAVVTNSIPNTGISLPFFSYGGSSLIMLFIEMGILLSISKNAKIIK